MIHYAQFYCKLGKLEGVGTDSVLPLDGRLGLAKAQALAEQRMAQLNERHASYDSYELRRCKDLFPFTNYTTYFRSHS